MNPGHQINYKTLRKINPEAARMAVLQYLKSNGGNISDAARVFGINRPVVHDILSRQGRGGQASASTWSPVGSGWLTPRGLLSPRRWPCGFYELMAKEKRNTAWRPFSPGQIPTRSGARMAGGWRTTGQRQMEHRRCG